MPARGNVCGETRALMLVTMRTRSRDVRDRVPVRYKYTLISPPSVGRFQQSWTLQTSTFRGEFNATKIGAIRVPQKIFF